MNRPSIFDGKVARRDAAEEALERTDAFQRAILAIPEGRVSTYGKVAEAAGYARQHRAVARLLSSESCEHLPWHRVVGADGLIRTSGASAKTQRNRLRQEGVTMVGNRINLSVYLYKAPATLE